MTSDFMKEQIEAVQTNSTLVESYQQTHGVMSGTWNHFKQIFGVDWWNWAIPTFPAILPDYFEEVVPAEVGKPSFKHVMKTD